MFLWIYVYIYIHVYLHIIIHVYITIHIYIYIHIFICIYLYVQYMYISTCIYIYICMENCGRCLEDEWSVDWKMFTLRWYGSNWLRIKAPAKDAQTKIDGLRFASLCHKSSDSPIVLSYTIHLVLLKQKTLCRKSNDNLR